MGLFWQALRLIEIVARAWRARRNQPNTFGEAEDWFMNRRFYDESGELREDLIRSAGASTRIECAKI